MGADSVERNKMWEKIILNSKVKSKYLSSAQLSKNSNGGYLFLFFFIRILN